jgi:hypothetical protein
MTNETMIENNMGIRCVIPENGVGYVLGTIFIHGKLIETPLVKGIFRLRNSKNQTEHWFSASKVEEVSNTQAILSGNGKIEDVAITFKITFETPLNVQAVRITYEFSVNEDLKDYQACLQFHTDFNHQWKAHLYPWVEDSKWVERERLDNMGIPSVFLYCEDRTIGLLWGIDPNSDYLNPTTWTRDFGLYFIDGVQPAQFRVGGEGLCKEVNYYCPMQIVVTDQIDPDAMIKDLMENWINLNQYEVLPLLVRSSDDALRIFIEGRHDKTEAWIPSKGYSLHGTRHTFLYFGVQGMAAYFDYLLYEMTGDTLWRERAFEQADFIVQGQNRDFNDFNFGAIHTTYQLEWLKDYGPHGPGFNSDDRFNIGYKPDISALMARYLLRLWTRVKEHEGIDRQDWYETAMLAAKWIIRQQNNDGGLPQKVEMKPLEMRWGDEEGNIVIQPFKSRSSSSGRALPSVWQIHKISGESRYKYFLASLEDYTLKCVQNQHYFTGHHPDLPPYELEEASIWGVAEYWLNRYDETNDEAYLRHAEANAFLALSWWCPKDLSWVKNPTQGGSAEQQHFQQYSVYNYQNRKLEGLWRLHQQTGNPLFLKLFDRILQNIFFTQETEGGNKGGTYERIADPWLVRKETEGGAYFDSLGVNYTNEQALDCFVQILELFRMGKDLYEGVDLVHKIYPDGVCYYSKDIRSMQKVPLLVFPSAGTIQLTVNSWNAENKSFVVTSSLENDISLSLRIDRLEPVNWYAVSANGNEIGSFQSNPSGVITFSCSGNYHKQTMVFLKENFKI